MLSLEHGQGVGEGVRGIWWPEGLTVAETDSHQTVSVSPGHTARGCTDLESVAVGLSSSQ